MQTKFNKLNEYFAYQIDACTRKGNALAQDLRQDEANFQRIRANVFDIFRTVLSAARKKYDDPEKVEEFFLLKVRQIPENWEHSLTQARDHGDTETAHIESVKLQAAREILDRFKAVWEEHE